MDISQNRLKWDWTTAGMNNRNQNKLFIRAELKLEWVVLLLICLLYLVIRIDCCKLLKYPQLELYFLLTK